MEKLKLSEIEDISEVSDRVYEVLNSSLERYIAIGSELSAREGEKGVISSDGSTVYFFDDVSEEGEGDLYRMEITDGKIGEPTLYDSGVMQSFIRFIADDKLAYCKNYVSGHVKGDFFINGEEIDYDVRLDYYPYFMDDAVFYFTDWNSEKRCGTLKMFKDGVKTKIADDVFDYVITNDNSILYLYDYSTNYYTGTLYMYKNGERKKLDEDVITPLWVNNHKIKREGPHYIWGGYYIEPIPN